MLVGPSADPTVRGTNTTADTLAEGYTNNPINMWFTAKKSIRVGMTEFGEFATPAKAGIAYGANEAEWKNTESWASEYILSKYWIQGWTFSMNYMRQAEERSIHAWAIYSDLTKDEDGRQVYSWFGDFSDFMVSDSVPTKGSLHPSGVEVLYDSARLLVARTSTIITDEYYEEDVAKVTFTLVFNKDTKYAIAYKDVKILLDSKILDRIKDFAFTERYEIDLARGVNPSNTAYIHYYPEFQDSPYIHPLVGNSTFDVLQAFNPDKNYIFFAGYWPSCTEFTVYNPLVPSKNVVQRPSAAADPDELFCNFDAMRILTTGDDVVDCEDDHGPTSSTNYGHVYDMPVEPSTPWVIAQWRYTESQPDTRAKCYVPAEDTEGVLEPAADKILNFLAKGDIYREIRFVEVFGMTDYNSPLDNIANDSPNTPNYPTGVTAKDMDAGDSVNFVDVEVQYLLNKVFNPEDLTTIGNIDSKPFLWTGLGQSSATTDSAGGIMLTDLQNKHTPLSLFDRHDELFPWTFDNAFEMRGTIPYGLDEFGGNYGEDFVGTAGSDDTSYYRTGLKGFAFSVYDGVGYYTPQPIAGGFSRDGTDFDPPSYPSVYWYPSKDPLTERWSYDGATFTEASYPDETNTYEWNGILTVGGVKANGLARYFNDMQFAIAREGTEAAAYVYYFNSNGVLGSAPTSDPAIGTYDFFPISTWNTSSSEFGYKEGYAVISLARDLNGTRGLSIYGWDGRDTYWASAWASQYLDAAYNDWVPPGATAIILNIAYSAENREPTGFKVVKVLGTITEFGLNQFWDTYAAGSFDNSVNTWDCVIPAPWGRTETTVGTQEIVLPVLASSEEYGPCEYKVWWFAKLLTTSDAHVDFDP